MPHAGRAMEDPPAVDGMSPPAVEFDEFRSWFPTSIFFGLGFSSGKTPCWMTPEAISEDQVKECQTWHHKRNGEV